MYEWIQQQIHSNQFLAGGAFLALIGTAGVLSRKFIWYGVQQSKLLLFCQCHFENSWDFTSLNWLMSWVAKQEKTKRAKRVTIRCIGGDDDVELTPAPGRHFLRWRGRRVIIDRNVTTGNGSSNNAPTSAGFRQESWTLYLQGTRKHLDEFIADCRSQYKDSARQQILVHVTTGYGWECRPKSKRPINTVILPLTIRAELVSELEEFYQSRDRYIQHGRPWRRGYLFEGSPGNGKTSCALALASTLNKDIYMLNIGSIEDGNAMVQALMRVPDDVILLIEDMDRDLEDITQRVAAHAAPDNRPRTVGESYAGSKPVSVSLLLNALDGLLASEGRILIITTNHPERIDPALLRPGRIDRRIRFEPDPEMYAQMWLAFFPGEPTQASSFAALLADSDSTMAAVQDLLVRYGQQASQHVGELKANNAYSPEDSSDA